MGRKNVRKAALEEYQDLLKREMKGVTGRRTDLSVSESDTRDVSVFMDCRVPPHDKFQKMGESDREAYINMLHYFDSQLREEEEEQSVDMRGGYGKESPIDKRSGHRKQKLELQKERNRGDMRWAARKEKDGKQDVQDREDKERRAARVERVRLAVQSQVLARQNMTAKKPVKERRKQVIAGQSQKYIQKRSAIDTSLFQRKTPEIKIPQQFLVLPPILKNNYPHSSISPTSPSSSNARLSSSKDSSHSQLPPLVKTPSLTSGKIMCDVSTTSFILSCRKSLSKSVLPQIEISPPTPVNSRSSTRTSSQSSTRRY